MKNLNTKSIINFLPFDSRVKLDLLEKYDSLPKTEQIRISDLVWDAFDTVYEIKIRENFDKGIEEAQKNGTKPDESFYGKILEKTQKDLEKALTSSEDSQHLSDARKSMEKIVREINASKKN